MNQQFNSKTKSGMSRRNFLRLIKYASIELALATVAGGIYVKEFEPTWLDITEINLKLPRLSKAFSGFRLVQFSDLHYGGWMNADRLAYILSVVSSLSPDLVAITGDFVLDQHRSFLYEDQIQYEELSSALRTFTDRHQTVGVSGNHDYWTKTVAIKDVLQKSGIIDLNNGVHTIKSAGETFFVAGVDDVIAGRDRLITVLGQLPAEGSVILLAHEPDFADTSAVVDRFDLQLSGHSHGGQIVIPFVGPLALPYLGQKYSEGLYRVGNMLHYTNRGVGMKPPFVRFNCRPEITVFTLLCA